MLWLANKVVGDRSLNPEGEPQVYKEVEDAIDKYFNFGERVLPPGAKASQIGQEVAISFPPSYAAQACRILARFAWSREAPGRVSAGVQREACKGRLYQMKSKVARPSKKCDGYQAPFLVLSPG